MSSANSDKSIKTAAIIGGGPAGLMAAEVLVRSGIKVSVYESMPTAGRKFLRAGLGGLNITHNEPYKDFCIRYGDRQKHLQSMLDEFTPDKLRQWVHELGIETFVGSSGRVFPREMKAAPLLRTWVHRLKSSGVEFYQNHRFVGFDKNNKLELTTADGTMVLDTGVVILALGGASWPELGSTGNWTPWLAQRGVEIAPWQPANCGFTVDWSELFKQKFDHSPLKSVALTFTDLDGQTETRQGELMVCDWGIEGSLVYAFSKRLRESLLKNGEATFTLDLLPGKNTAKIESDLSRPRGSKTLSRHLQTCLGDDALKRNLLYEALTRDQMNHPGTISKCIKHLPITVSGTRPIAEAISTAGGVKFESCDNNLMLKDLPGIFVCGEMLDWEAPTGGYLLTACFATGQRAGQGALAWLQNQMII